MYPRTWVVHADRRRLAKRHGDTRIERYREMGLRPERIIGLMARWCGVTADRREMDADEFRAGLDLASLDREAVVFTAEDEQWLTG